MDVFVWGLKIDDEKYTIGIKDFIYHTRRILKKK